MAGKNIWFVISVTPYSNKVWHKIVQTLAKRMQIIRLRQFSFSINESLPVMTFTRENGPIRIPPFIKGAHFIIMHCGNTTEPHKVGEQLLCNILKLKL